MMKNLYLFIESQTQFGMPRCVWASMKTKIGCSSIKFKDYPQRCTTSDKHLLIKYAKQPMENHRGQTLDKKLHLVKG